MHGTHPPRLGTPGLRIAGRGCSRGRRCIITLKTRSFRTQEDWSIFRASIWDRFFLAQLPPALRMSRTSTRQGETIPASQLDDMLIFNMDASGIAKTSSSTPLVSPERKSGSVRLANFLDSDFFPQDPPIRYCSF